MSIAAAVTAYLFFCTIRSSASFTAVTPLQVFAVSAVLLILIVLYRVFLLEKMSPLAIDILSYSLIAAAFLFQMYIAYTVRLTPQVDLSYVYDEALYMVSHGTTTMAQNLDELLFYPNNVPITILIYWVFRVAIKIGWTDFRFIGGFFNVCCLLIMYILVYRIAHFHTSKKNAAAVLFFFLLNPVYYAYASYYYTDTISSCLLAITIFLFELALLMGRRSGQIPECEASRGGISSEEGDGKGGPVLQSVLFYVFLVLSGIFFFATFTIRITSLFTGIAYVVVLLFTRKWKQLLKTCLPVILAVLLASAAWKPFKAIYFPYDTTDTSVTWTHYVNMGQSDDRNGRYYHPDVERTKAQPTKEGKNAVNLASFKERVGSRSFLQNCRFALRKLEITFATSHKEYREFTQFVEAPSWIFYKMFTWESVGFRGYMQSYQNVYYLLILTGLLLALFSQKADPLYNVVMILLFGAYLFYVFWEAHPRHCIIFMIPSTMLLIPLLSLWHRKAGD